MGEHMTGTEQLGFPWPTVGGYDFHEVLSALQKSIRRGLEEDALFWATELYLSNYANHAWGRFLVISSEDVGVADSSVFSLIYQLHAHWKIHQEESSARLHFIHAVLALVRAPKSRIVDHALIVYLEGPREKRPVPDYALDKHTSRGRAMGRGNKHFFAVGALLGNQPLEDLYEERAKQIRK